MKQRDRLIRAGFWTSDELSDCGIEAHFLLGALCSIADREGRLKNRPRKIKLYCMPFYDVDVHVLLVKLIDTGHLRQYEVDGCSYLLINKFTKHNSFHWREAESTLPAPPVPTVTMPDGSVIEDVDSVQLPLRKDD